METNFNIAKFFTDKECTTIDASAVVAQIKDDIATGFVKVETTALFRRYVSTTDPSKVVPMTTREEVAVNYFNVFIKPRANTQFDPIEEFEKLPRFSIYVGKPDTGKTYKATHLANALGVPYITLIGRDNLNFETLVSNFKLVNGAPVFEESLALKFLSDPKEERCIIIIEEGNTLLTGVLKTLQPLLDDTSESFEYSGTVYKKNPNCKFIMTLNDKDKGISILPDAILSRAFISYFSMPSDETLAEWCGLTKQYVSNVHSMFSLANIEHLFGARQLKVLKHIKNAELIKSHLRGLLALSGKNEGNVNTLEITNLLNKLV